MMPSKRNAYMCGLYREEVMDQNERLRKYLKLIIASNFLEEEIKNPKFVKPEPYVPERLRNETEVDDGAEAQPTRAFKHVRITGIKKAPRADW